MQTRFHNRWTENEQVVAMELGLLDFWPSTLPEPWPSLMRSSFSFVMPDDGNLEPIEIPYLVPVAAVDAPQNDVDRHRQELIRRSQAELFLEWMGISREEWQLLIPAEQPNSTMNETRPELTVVRLLSLLKLIEVSIGITTSNVTAPELEAIWPTPFDFGRFRPTPDYNELSRAYASVLNIPPSIFKDVFKIYHALRVIEYAHIREGAQRLVFWSGFLMTRESPQKAKIYASRIRRFKRIVIEAILKDPSTCRSHVAVTAVSDFSYQLRVDPLFRCFWHSDVFPLQRWIPTWNPIGRPAKRTQDLTVAFAYDRIGGELRAKWKGKARPSVQDIYRAGKPKISEHVAELMESESQTDLYYCLIPLLAALFSDKTFARNRLSLIKIRSKYKNDKLLGWIGANPDKTLSVAIEWVQMHRF